MAPVVGAPLNAEPANPEERKDNNLQPKSYADAVEEEAPAATTNGTKVTNGVNGANGSTGTNGAASGKHAASVLRIVDTGAPEKKDAKDKEVERPSMERQESQQEYTATVCSQPLLLMYYRLQCSRDLMIPRELHLVINIAKLDRKAATAPWDLLLRKVK